MNNKHIIFSITTVLVIFLSLFIYFSNNKEKKEIPAATEKIVEVNKKEDKKREAIVIESEKETKNEIKEKLNAPQEEKVDIHEKKEINDIQVENDIQKLPEHTIDTDSSGAIVDDIMDISDKSETLLIDVRSNDKFERDHIEGAINVTYDEIKNGALDSLPKDKKIQVYCQKGIKSGMAANHLKECGFENVENLGGIEGLKMPHATNNQEQTN